MNRRKICVPVGSQRRWYAYNDDVGVRHRTEVGPDHEGILQQGLYLLVGKVRQIGTAAAEFVDPGGIDVDAAYRETTIDVTLCNGKPGVAQPDYGDDCPALVDGIKKFTFVRQLLSRPVTAVSAKWSFDCQRPIRHYRHRF
jgi:hypothetical protein